jgi:ribosomal protein L31
MVFIFPGILFRRAFFSGEYQKHFESGNNLERLMWNMLCSILMLAAFCGFIYFFNSYSPFKVEFNITVTDVTDTFLCLYENQLPTVFASEERIIQTGNLLFSIYSFSLLVGFFMNRMIFFLGLEKRYTALQFQNRWYYLTNSTKKNNLNHSIGDLYYTRIDVKSAKEELFTGKLHDILYDKEGKVEAITIQEAYKYYRLNTSNDASKIAEVEQLISDNDPQVILHSKSPNSFIYRKRIKGDLFTILNNDLENIAITYIKISNFYKKFQKFLKIAISILILLVTLFSISYVIWDFQLFRFQSYFKRVLFCVVTPFVFSMGLLLLLTLFNIKELRVNGVKYFKDLKDAFVILILFTIPYLYIFSLLKGIYVILMFIAYTIFASVILPKKDEK